MKTIKIGKWKVLRPLFENYCKEIKKQIKLMAKDGTPLIIPSGLDQERQRLHKMLIYSACGEKDYKDLLEFSKALEKEVEKFILKEGD